MKKALVIIALMLSATGVNAMDANYLTKEIETCQKLSKITMVFAEKRQAGVSKRVLLDAIAGVDPDIDRTMQQIADIVWETPVYAHRQQKLEAIRSAENSMLRGCLAQSGIIPR